MALDKTEPGVKTVRVGAGRRRCVLDELTVARAASLARPPDPVFAALLPAQIGHDAVRGGQGRVVVRDLVEMRAGCGSHGCWLRQSCDVLEAAQEQTEAAMQRARGEAPRKPKRNRGYLPPHLLRVERVIDTNYRSE